MTNAVFHVSPVWVHLLKLLRIRRIFELMIVLVIWEGLALAAPMVVGEEVNQPFRMFAEPCHEGCRSANEIDHFWTNEMGARGDMMRPNVESIATFGSSTMAETLLDQADTFPEKLAAHYRADGVSVHVDNYGRDGAGNKEIEVLLSDMAAHGKHYDEIIIMDHWGHEDRAATRENTYQYTSRWYAKGPVAFAPIIWRGFQQQLGTEPRLIAAEQWVAGEAKALRDVVARPTRGEQAEVFHHPPELSPGNRALRASGRIQLVDIRQQMTDQQKAYIEARVDRLTALARKVAPEVVILTQPVAYADNELPGVSSRWDSLYPVSETQPVYKSDRSVAEGIRLTDAVAAYEARQDGAVVVELDSLVKPFLAARDDLFLDKWHAAAPGAALWADLVYADLKRQHRGFHRHA